MACLPSSGFAPGCLRLPRMFWRRSPPPYAYGHDKRNAQAYAQAAELWAGRGLSHDAPPGNRSIGWFMGVSSPATA
eukprot:8411570-Lingulodinium_polyedra.AAC.1